MKLILKNTKLTFKTMGFDADAVMLMAKYTKELTDAQKWAVNGLVSDLKNAGVYSRLTAAYFPALASSVQEAMADAVTDVAPATTPGAYYVLDANGLGFAPVSSPFGGALVNTNLQNSIESIFASVYIVKWGNAGLDYYKAIGGGYPKIGDYRKDVFPNNYTGNSGAALATSSAEIPETKHYALSWRYTIDENLFHIANADFCFDGIQKELTLGSTDGLAMDDTFGMWKIAIGSGITQNASAGSGDSRCAAVLVFGSTTITERDAINAALVSFNAAFWGQQS